MGVKIWALYRVREEYEKEERKKGDQGKSGYKRWLKKVFKNGGGKRFQFPLNKGQKKVKNSCHFFFQIYDAVWWSSKKMQHVKWKERSDHTKHKRCFKVLECNCRRRILMMRQIQNSYYYLYATNGKRGFGNRVTPTVNEQC